MTGQFTVSQVTDGSAVLSVIPNGTTTITGPLVNVCSSGVRVSYYIFGGTPPYTIAASFPDVVRASIAAELADSAVADRALREVRDGS